MYITNITTISITTVVLSCSGIFVMVTELEVWTTLFGTFVYDLGTWLVWI